MKSSELYNCTKTNVSELSVSFLIIILFLSIIPLNVAAESSESEQLVLECLDDDGDLTHFQPFGGVIYCTILNESTENISLSIQLDYSTVKSITSPYLLDESDLFRNQDTNLSEEQITLCGSCSVRFWFVVSALSDLDKQRFWKSLDIEIDVRAIIDDNSRIIHSFTYSMMTKSPLEIELDPRVENFETIISHNHSLDFWIEITNVGECDVTVYDFQKSDDWWGIDLIGTQNNHSILVNQSINLTFTLSLDPKSTRNIGHGHVIWFSTEPQCEDEFDRTDRIVLQVKFDRGQQTSSSLFPTIFLIVLIALVFKRIRSSQ